MSTAEQVQVATEVEQSVGVEQSKIQEIDEGLLRKDITKKWPGQDSWYLKVVVLWNKENCYRVRANWYNSRTIGHVVQSKFIHAIVSEDGSIFIKDKTIKIEDTLLLKDK